MTARRFLAVALTFALLVPAALLTAGPAAAATTTKVVEFNAADGKACTKRCLAPIAGLVSGADVVAVQEVCRNNLDSFAAAQNLHATFSAQTTADTRCNGKDRGNALLSRYSLSGAKVFPLAAPTTPTGNTFTLLCAVVHQPGQRLQACSTHLIAGGSPDRASQVKQIVGYTAKMRQKGQKVIVSGDFNLRQGDAAFKPMKKSFVQKHPGNADGVYVQYVWFSLPGVSGLTASKSDGGTSDHDVLVSSARLR